MVGDLTPYDVPFSCCNYQIMCVYIYIYIKVSIQLYNFKRDT